MNLDKEPSAFKENSETIRIDYSKLMQLSVEELLYEAVERAKIIFLVKNESQKKSIARIMSIYYSFGRLKIKDAVLDECILDFMCGDPQELDCQLQMSFLQKKNGFYKYLKMEHLSREQEYQEIDNGEIYSPKQLEITEAVVSMSLGDLDYYHKMSRFNPDEVRSDRLDSISLLLNGGHSSFTINDKVNYKKLTDPRNEVLASIDLSRPDSEIILSLKNLLPSWRESLRIQPQEGVTRERNSPGKSILKKIITNKLIEFMDQIIFDVLHGNERTKKEICLTIYNNPSDDFINKTIVSSIKQLSCADYVEKVFSYIKSEGIRNKQVSEFMRF